MNSLFNRAGNLKVLAEKLYGKYMRQAFLLVVLGFFSGFLEGIGIGVLVPIFSYIVGGGALGSSFLERVLLGLFSYIHLNAKLKTLLILVALLFVFRAIVLFVFEYLRIRIITNYEKETRSDLYHKALHLEWPYLLKQKIGHLENMLMVDVGSSVKLLSLMAQTVLDFASLFMYIVVALSISPFITFLTLGLGGAAFFVSKPVLRKNKNYARERIVFNKLLAHQINESVIGLKTIKSMGIEEKVSGAVAVFFDKFNDLRVKQLVSKTIPALSLQPMSVLFIIGIFAVSFSRPDFNLAGFLAIVYIVQRIFVYVDKTQSALYDAVEAAPAVARVLAFKEDASRHWENRGGKKQFKLDFNLEFKNINFAYAKNPVLAGVSFFIKKGEMVGLIGLSGAGKTTIADLMLYLFKPQSGEILLDGVNIADIDLRSWRRNVGYVAQDVFLKNDTVGNNIKFYEELSHENMVKAAKMANIHAFIESLPRKFETVVGERGVMLSAGQRQRIILARVLAKDPQILVLDEATSALDNESEALIKKTLNDLKGRATIIVIAHRLSSVMDADRIMALGDGKILEEGSPHALVKDEKSYFYKMRKLAA